MSDTEIANAPSIPISEHNRFLIAIHNAMRADGRRLLGAVEQMPVGDTERASALGHAFSAITTLIHDHHWTEDDVMYPFLMEHVASFEADAIRLENDHIDLDAGMARISARFRLLAHPLTVALWRDTHRHLADETATFNDLLVSHLDREEAVVLPTIDSKLSAAEQRLLQKEESKVATFGTCAGRSVGARERDAG